jgi:excisionase family DNA binding protein
MRHENTHEPNEKAFPYVLTPRESMTVMRLSRSTFYRRLRAGEIPSVRFGRKILIRKIDLIRLLTPAGIASDPTGDLADGATMKK